MAEPLEFQLKTKTVQAMQHDGTIARAYEILAWVTRLGGKGYLESGYDAQGPDLLMIGKSNRPVLANGWVVSRGQKFIEVWDDEEFSATYERVPKPVMRND